MILESLTQFIRWNWQKVIADNLNISPDLLQKVDSDIVGSLLWWLSSNAQNWDAWNILDALKNDRTGSDMQDPGVILGKWQASWWKIVNHILWSQQGKLAQYISKNYWVDEKVSSSLITTLAPFVMSYLGKHVFGWDTSKETLTETLANEKKAIQENSPTPNFLTQLLDKDWDGDVDLKDFL